MRFKELAITIDPNADAPLFLQIVEQTVAAIREGRLPSGTPLPGRRAVAEHLNVSRNTVVAAFGELMAMGLIEMRERSGTYVVDRLPEQLVKFAPKESSVTFILPTRNDLVTSQMAKVTKLSEGLPDPRLLPKDELGKAYQQALLSPVEETLEQGSPLGHRTLRKALSVYLWERRGVTAHPDSILVTRGNRMGLHLLAQGLLTAEDRVAVEDPGNPVAWESFREAKARLIGIPVDDQGLNVDAFEEHLKQEKIRMLYLTPRFQIPTTVRLSNDRRKRLLQLAQQHRFAIIEEDSEAEYTFEGDPILPMASSDGAGAVIHLASFSRLLAPGVRLGLLTGPQSVVDHLARLRQQLEGPGDQVLERAIADLLNTRKVIRHAQKVHKIYRDRRDLALACIRELFESRLDVRPPEGGLSLWIRLNRATDLELWCQRCAEKGILFQTGRSFSLDKSPTQAFRFGYGSFNSGEMAGILARMRREWPTD